MGFKYNTCIYFFTSGPTQLILNHAKNVLNLQVPVHLQGVPGHVPLDQERVRHRLQVSHCDEDGGLEVRPSVV